MNEPLVSIVIPCYKQAQYLPENLESVLAQTYRNWEAIVVNDGSPDDTEAVAKDYVGKDSRISYIYKDNGGPSSTRNVGISHARGEFILPLDADDVIDARYVELAVEAFRKNPRLKVVYCQALFFGVKQGPWEGLCYRGYKSLLLYNSIFCSALYRKADWESIGGYDEKMRDGYEDWEFFIRLLKGGGEVYQIPLPLFRYRIKEVSMNTHALERQEDNLLYIYSKHRDAYVSYFCIGGLRDMIMELENLRAWRKRHQNKWYRKMFSRLGHFFK